jgi:hypothetical protein
MTHLLLLLSHTDSTSARTYKLPDFTILHGHATGKPWDASKV